MPGLDLPLSEATRSRWVTKPPPSSPPLVTHVAISAMTTSRPAMPCSAATRSSRSAVVVCSKAIHRRCAHPCAAHGARRCDQGLLRPRVHGEQRTGSRYRWMRQRGTLPARAEIEAMRARERADQFPRPLHQARHQPLRRRRDADGGSASFGHSRIERDLFAAGAPDDTDGRASGRGSRARSDARGC